MPVANGDILRIVLKGQNSAAGRVYHVYHVRVTTSAPPPDTSLVGAIESHLRNSFTRYKGIISDNIRYNSVEVLNLTQDIKHGEIACDSSWNSSRGGAEALPAQSAVVMSFKTNKTKSVGKKFWAGLVESALTSGDLGAVAYGTILPALLDYIGSKSFSIPGFNLSLIFGNAYKPASTWLLADWVSGSLSQILGTQRRRKKGIGA